MTSKCSYWLILLFLFIFGCSMASEAKRGVRVKRIIFGLEVDSHESLHTQYMVSIKRTHGCDTAKKHEWSKWCEFHNHKCGGALIAPDMVLTNCHCMIYEHYLVEGVKGPPLSTSFYNWTTTTEKPAKPEKLQTFYFEIQPLHPVLNLMTVWMGSVDIEEMPQKQFAKAFFPHSECSYREILLLSSYKDSKVTEEELRQHKRPNFDVGVVRTWAPFLLNKDVQLVPMVYGQELLRLHQSVMNKMSVCLLTGFGLTEYGYGASRLRYSFRHMQCTNVCQLDTREIHQCEVCSTSIARPDKNVPLNWAQAGDSGSPIVCHHKGRHVLFSVHSQVVWDRFIFHQNATVSISIALACVKDLVTQKNLQYLKEMDDKNSDRFFKLDEVAMGPFETPTTLRTKN